MGVITNYNLAFLYYTKSNRFVTPDEYHMNSLHDDDVQIMFVPRMQRYQAFIFRSATEVPNEIDAPVHGVAGWKKSKEGAARISFETRCSVWTRKHYTM